MTAEDGGSILVEIDLVSEEDHWKIYAVRETAGLVGFSSVADGPPDEKHQVMLVMETMGAFVDSVAAKDMTGLHDHISRLWASQIDVAGLEEIYKSFFSIGADAQIIKTVAPVFDGPATLSDNIMEIKGYYPTKPSRFNFDLKYIYEGTGWKPAGVSMEIK